VELAREVNIPAARVAKDLRSASRGCGTEWPKWPRASRTHIGGSTRGYQELSVPAAIPIPSKPPGGQVAC
jgi:hypothetical protein